MDDWIVNGRDTHLPDLRCGLGPLALAAAAVLASLVAAGITAGVVIIEHVTRRGR